MDGRCPPPENIPNGAYGGYVVYRDGHGEGEWWVEEEWGKEWWVGWTNGDGTWTIVVQPTLPIR